ncbi:MAG: hypothetical protein RUMPE_00744 [Eubacteriales bacterium SKADARSKE-1]|nr:hypothetical protein [Eubacteriales bacterium SKADARSKE-1]
MLRIIRFIFGYVIFSATGCFPERFMNLTARYGICLWNVKKNKNTFTASAMASEYKTLRKIAKKSSMKIKLSEKRGLIFITKKYKSRKGIPIGILCFFVIIYFLSLHIWNIDIKGNNSIEENEICSLLSELSIESGTLKNKIDTSSIERMAMNRFSNISWFSVNIRGCNLEIELKEKITPPELVEKETPCNIKSTSDAHITRMEVYSGTAEVKNGDAVVKGQLLVNGIVEDSFGKNILQHADAKIFATTIKTLKESTDLNSTEEVATGKVIKRKYIKILSLKFPLTLTPIPKGNFKRKIKKNNIKVAKASLPITMYKEYWEEFAKKKKIFTKDEACSITKENLKKREELELKNIKIQKKDTLEKIIDNKYYIIATYNCEENIATKEPILLE